MKTLGTAAFFILVTFPAMAVPHLPHAALPSRSVLIKPIPLRSHAVIVPIPTHSSAAVRLMHTPVHRYPHYIGTQLSRYSRPASTVVITQAQDNKTVSARVGQTIQFHLGKDLQWQVVDPKSPVLKPVGGAAGNVRFLARAPGSVEIKATGRPIARPGQMTAMYILLFKTTVLVRK